MPRIFVPGPSVRPNFGSPAQFIKGIADTAEGISRRRIMDERTQNDKLFKDQTMGLNQRKQDFTEAAPQRAEELRVQTLAREADKFKTIQDYAKGAQYAGGDRLTGLDDRLRELPEYAKLDEQGQLAARNQYILNNPQDITDPAKFAEIMTAGLTQSGKFTGPEIQSAVASEVSRLYPTASPDIIKELFLKPKDFANTGSGTTNIFGGRVSAGRGGNSFDFVSDPVSQKSKNDLLKEEYEMLGLTDKRTKSTLGVGHELAGIPIIGGIFDHNVTQQNYAKAVSRLEGEGLSTPEAIAVLRQEIDGSLESTIDFNNLTKTDINRLKRSAEGNKAQQTQIFNKKGGGISAAGQAAGVSSPADLANASFAHNQALLSRLTPQALSDDGVVNAFLDSIGGDSRNNTRQGGSGGGRLLSPEASGAQIDADYAALLAEQGGAQNEVTQAIIDGQGGAATAEATAEAPAPAQFQVGGPVQAETARNRIFDLIQGAIPPPPHQLLAEGVTGAANAGNKIFNDVSEFMQGPQPGILTQQSAGPVIDPDARLPQTVALNQAKALQRAGKIKPVDNSSKSLLDAYYKYLEAQ